MDMIQTYIYTGWTSAYSVLRILLQLQSFLFAENIPQLCGGAMKGATGGRGSKEKVAIAIQAAEKFSCNLETHDGRSVKHKHSTPWPPLPEDNNGIVKCARSQRTPAAKTLPHLGRDLCQSVFLLEPARATSGPRYLHTMERCGILLQPV